LILFEQELMMPTSQPKYIFCKIFSVWFFAGKRFLSIDSAFQHKASWNTSDCKTK